MMKTPKVTKGFACGIIVVFNKPFVLVVYQKGLSPFSKGAIYEKKSFFNRAGQFRHW